MAHSTEQSHILNLLDKLVESPSSTEDESSSSDSDSESNGGNRDRTNISTPEPEISSIQVLSPPPTVSQKRKRGPKPKSNVYYASSDIIGVNMGDVVAILAPEPATPKLVTYSISMISFSDAKKPATKRTTKHATCQVQTDKPWSTLQAQLLAKISDALKPKTIHFTNYEALFHIPRLLSKPGMVLAGDADYQILLQRVASIKKLDPIVYVDITERAVCDEEKENIEPEDDSEDEERPKKKKKKKLVCCRFSSHIDTPFPNPLCPRILPVFLGTKPKTRIYQLCASDGCVLSEDCPTVSGHTVMSIPKLKTTSRSVMNALIVGLQPW
jgi:hypothetical protein